MSVDVVGSREEAGRVRLDRKSTISRALLMARRAKTRMRLCVSVAFVARARRKATA